MIMATKLINQRIKDVMCARKRAGKADITPTLVDLERTHILYVNAHFKPFAAIGYEYNKLRPQSGNPTLGGGVTFSIAQFGDFFYDMVGRTRLSSFQANVGQTPLQSAGTPTNLAAFPQNGHLANGDVQANTWYNVCDSFGNVLVTGTAGQPNAQINYRNFVRYCEFPGNRLYQGVKFDVNGNPLDQYDTMIPVMLEKFCTTPNKRVGFDRLVGQEVPLQGYSGLHSGAVFDADAANTPPGITRWGNGQSNETVAIYNYAAGGVTATGTINTTLGQTPLDQHDVSRVLLQVVNGAQTPKPIQPPLEVWNKLRFWFNDDVRLSIASVSIPFGQRFISVDLATQDLLAFEFPSIYLQTIVEAAGPANGPVTQRTITYTPIFQRWGTTDIAIEKMEMYVNNIFVNPEIHDIYIKRIGFSLIRVYRQHTQRCNQDSADEKLLSQLKWPVEYMFVGLRPTWNIKATTTGSAAGASSLVTGGNQNQWRDWHRMTRQVDSIWDDPDLSETTGGGAIATSGSSIGSVMPPTYWLPVPTVDTLTLTSHGITIYDTFADKFFSQYMPFNYGGPALVTPDDPGALFVNMALFPRSYQPSGHLNISRARETYLKWTTSYISAKTPADLLAVAVAINFLLVTDGSAVLRYST
jgi:hypothetical protein